MKKVIARVITQTNDRTTEDDLATISEAAVNYIVYSSLSDPPNEERIVQQLGYPRTRDGCASYSLLIIGFFIKFIKLISRSNSTDGLPES